MADSRILVGMRAVADVSPFVRAMREITAVGVRIAQSRQKARMMAHFRALDGAGSE